MLVPPAPHEQSTTDPKRIQGLNYFKLLKDILATLHDVALARDKAGNRDLHFDQYVSSVLWSFTRRSPHCAPLCRPVSSRTCRRRWAARRPRWAPSAKPRRSWTPSLSSPSSATWRRGWRRRHRHAKPRPWARSLPWTARHRFVVCVLRARANDWTVWQQRELSAAARQAHVVFDAEVDLGGHKAHGVLTQPYRVVIIERPSRSGDTTRLVLISNRLDLDAELIALAYHYRWEAQGRWWTINSRESHELETALVRLRLWATIVMYSCPFVLRQRNVSLA